MKRTLFFLSKKFYTYLMSKLMAVGFFCIVMLLVGTVIWLRHYKGAALIKKEMYKRLDHQAKQGNKKAAYRFVELAYKEKDSAYYPLIFKWVNLLASYQKDPAIWMLLGDMFEVGFGTQRDAKRALMIYEEALSADIRSGKSSDLSRQSHNYIEKQIMRLRQELQGTSN